MEPGSGGYLWKCQRGDWSRRKEGRLPTRRMNGIETQPWGRTVEEGTSWRKIHLELLAEETDGV